MVSYICRTCGFLGRPEKKLKGSSKTEAFIWLVLLVPGPFYSLWRRIGLIKRCPHCKKSTMLSTKTFEGFELLKKQENDLVNGQDALIPQNYVPEIDINEFMNSGNNLQNESSFKGNLVQRDLKQEIRELAQKNKNENKSDNDEENHTW